MTIRTNRRAEAFDRALRAGSAADPTTAALVAVAGALATIPQRPAPAFSEALRAQLVSEAATVAASVSASTAAAVPAVAGLKALPKLLAKPAIHVATGGLAVTIAATGVGVGASRSLPGDPLYRVKKAVEDLQERFAGGTIAEADATLEHVRTRVDEIVALLARDGLGALAEVESVLAGIRTDLDTATSDLLAQARAGSRQAYDKLGATVRGLTAELTALRAALPPEARDELDAAMATLNSAAALLAALPVPVPEPSGSPKPTKSPAPTPTRTPSSSPSGSPSSTSTSVPPTTPPIVVPTTPPTSLPTELPTELPTITLPPVVP